MPRGENPPVSLEFPFCPTHPAGLWGHSLDLGNTKGISGKSFPTEPHGCGDLPTPALPLHLPHCVPARIKLGLHFSASKKSPGKDEMGD